MPPRRTLIVVGATLAVVALAFFLGRTTAPSKTITVQIDKAGKAETKAKAEEKAQAKTEAAAEDHSVVTKWKIKYRPSPTGGCEKAEEEIETGTEDSKKTKATSSASQKNTERTSKAEWHEHQLSKTVETAATRWAIGVSAGAGTDLRLRYQGDVAYRLVGGLWIAGALQVEQAPFRPAVLVGVRFAF